jgi:hypothetical protein
MGERAKGRAGERAKRRTGDRAERISREAVIQK